ncbi:hypothetical protein [Haematobacter sp. UBA3484]|uniref:hypothetical protein n=1 Tax=Haematobacter sp. UBA3484 TaxID=1946582 RepID=UPI0025BABD51|nr:hypothetical protein [Haematobacter sp. UBA3484]
MKRDRSPSDEFQPEITCRGSFRGWFSKHRHEPSGLFQQLAKPLTGFSKVDHWPGGCAASREIGPVESQTSGFQEVSQQRGNISASGQRRGYFSAAYQQAAEKVLKCHASAPEIGKSARKRPEVYGFPAGIRQMANDFRSNTGQEAFFSSLLGAPTRTAKQLQLEPDCQDNLP